MSNLNYEAVEKKVNRLEKKLKNSKLRQLWKFYLKSLIPTLVLSKDGKFIAYNEAMFELTGYTHEEVSDLETMAYKIFQDEEYRNKFIQITRKSQYREKDIKSDEFVITKKDGEHCNVIFFFIDIFHKGKPTDIIAIQGMNLTEHEQVKESLSETHLKFNAIMSSLSDIVYRLDPGGRISFINNAVEKYGYTTEELIGKNIFELVHPEDRGKARYHINERRSGNRRTQSCEVRLLTKHRVPVPFEIRSKEVAMESFFMVEAEGLYKNDKAETHNFLGTQGIARDITVQKQAEKILQQYQFIVESAYDAIFFKDLKSCYIIANKKTIEFFGLSRDEVLGKNDYELLPNKKEAKKNIEDDQIIFRTGKPKEITKHMTGANGKEYWFQAIKVPHFDDRGNCIGLFGIARDITEQKLIEEALEKSEKKYRSLFDLSKDGIIFADMQGNIYDANQFFLDMIGCTIEEIKNSTCQQLTPKRWEKMEENIIKNQIQVRKYSDEYEKEYIRKDKTIFPVSIRVWLIEDEQGIPVGMWAIIRDITERKKAEEELREREELNFALFNYNPIESIVVDLEGIVTKCNIAKKESGDRLPDIGDIMYRDYAGRHEINMYSEMMECIRTGELKEFAEMKYDDRFLSIKIAPFSKGAIITSQDITERKKVENELKRSQEELRNLSAYLQSVREEERKSISREIHDGLCQMLTSLKIDIALLKQSIPDKQKSQIAQTQSILENTDAIFDVVRRISRELRTEILDHLGLISAIEWETKEFHDRTGIKLQLVLTQEQMNIDKNLSTAIFRILQETLTNITRHARAKKVKVSFNKKNDILELIVKDNGIGIKEEEIQSSNSLGLIGMRERAYYWHGKVKINGVQNKGTTITATFSFKQRGSDDKNNYSG